MLRQRAALLGHRGSVPAAFTGFFTLEEHQKAIDYNVAKLNFGLVRLIFKGLLLFGWFYSGLLAILDAYLYILIPHVVWQPIALIAAVSFSDSLVSLPFSLWSQFKIEEQFGFNRSTLKIFFTDVLKGALIGVILLSALGYPILTLMNALPLLWVFPAMMTYLLFQLLLVVLFPTVIAPLFNKFSPLQDESLREGIKRLVEEAGFKSDGVFVMDASKRSSHGNAYFTGLGKSRRIVFFDTLLKKLSSEQVLAVLAHEIGHLAHGHIRKSMIYSALLTCLGFMLVGYYTTRMDWMIALGLVPTSGLVLLSAMWLGSLLSVPLAPIISMLSRKNEFQADRYAIERTSAQALGEALLELYRGNAGTLVFDPIYARWNYSHPPLSERLQAMPYPAVVND